MTQIKIFTAGRISKIEAEINDFLKDKHVFVDDIKTLTVDDGIGTVYVFTVVYHTVDLDSIFD